MIVNVLAVAGGAFVGGCCRDALARIWNKTNWKYPLGTFAANMIGSLILGLLLGYMARGVLAPSMKALLVTGFCGGLTTFSTFTSEVCDMTLQHHRGHALLYWIGSVLLGLAVVWLGFLAGKHW